LLNSNSNLKGHFLTNQEIGKTPLSEISPTDVRWDTFRSQADDFQDLYKGTVYDSYADRMSACSDWLEFAIGTNLETGDSKLKLEMARFCRVPRCPICQWRRSLMWRAKAFKIMPKVIGDYPAARFLFLTLTVRNCPLVELRSTLVDMNLAWARLTQRKQFPAIGWVKSVEVTRGKDDTAHPHFHCLLMVNGAYFGRDYLSHDKWTELWKKSLRISYTPIVHVQAVKTISGADKGMLNAVLETIKYSVKPSDVFKGSSRQVDREWLVELTKQLYKTKSIATGGLLKDYLRELEEEPDDLIHVDELPDSEIESKGITLCFLWNQWIKKYALYNPPSIELLDLLSENNL